MGHSFCRTDIPAFCFYLRYFRFPFSFLAWIHANYLLCFKLSLDILLILTLAPWWSGVVVTVAQLYSTKPGHRFCAGSNPSRSMSGICDDKHLWQLAPAGNKVYCPSPVNHSAKTIHLISRCGAYRNVTENLITLGSF